MSGHKKWSEIKRKRTNGVSHDDGIESLLATDLCTCEHSRSAHRLNASTNETECTQCDCPGYRWDEGTDCGEEACGWSYDHDLETTYEGNDGRQFLCKTCGAEIWEDPET